MSTLDHLCEAVFQTLFQEAAGHVRRGTPVPPKICLYSAAIYGKRKVETVDISKALINAKVESLAQTFRKCINCPEVELATMVVKAKGPRDENTWSEEYVAISLLTKQSQVIKLCPIDRATKTLKLSRNDFKIP